MQTLQTGNAGHALHWEMYGVETVLSFSAMTTADGFQMTLERDHAPVITGRAADPAVLFRVSADLRQRLNQLGYESQPQTCPVVALCGGLAWGPASPLDASLITPLCGTAHRASCEAAC